MSSKVGRDFLLTRFKYALDYTVMLTNGFITLTAADWLVLTNGLRQAANYLYDATDGQVIFKSFTVANFSTPVALSNANIQLLPTGRSHALLNSNKLRLFASDTAFTAAGVSNQFKLHATLVHEMGHAFFGLLDEYTVHRKCDKTNHLLGQPISITNGTAVTVANSDHAFGYWVDKASVAHSDLVRSCGTNGVSCIMDGNVGSEFCVTANHIVSPAQAQQETNKAPCWVTMKQQQAKLAIPANLPSAGPGSSSANNTVPLPWDQSAARHVNIIGP